MNIHVNGIDLNYEACGSGPPILLIHGNGESMEIFDRLIPSLSEHYTVYAIDSRGHGKSSPVKELHYKDMAEDLACFIRELSIERPLFYGFSDGGILGLLLASTYPELLSGVLASGANVTPDGLFPKDLRIMKLIYFFTRSPKFRMMLTEPNITPEDLGRISIPVHLLAGSRDMIREEHTRAIAEAIPNCSLRILPGETHSSYVVHSEKLYPLLTEILGS